MVSPDVLKCLEVLNHGSDIDRFSANQYLRDAAEHTGSAEDSNILHILGGVLSMGYSDQDDCYLPQITLADGRRSFAMEDLDNSSVSVLKEIFPYLEALWIKAQLSDIIWIKTEEFAYAKIAISAYLALFEESLDPQEWVDCYQVISRAFSIAVRLGSKSPEFSGVISRIDKSIRDMDGTDPLFLSLKLIRLATPYVEKDSLKQYFLLAGKLFTQAKTNGEYGQQVIEEAFEVRSDLLKRLNRKEEIRTVKLELAEYYENLAAELDGQPYRAIRALQSAYNLYDKRLDSEKIIAIRSCMARYQQNGIETMQSVPFEFNISTIFNKIEELFEGLSHQEAIFEYGQLAVIYNIENTKNAVLEEQHKYIFKSMASQHILDREGHLVKIVSPLGFRESNENQELLRDHMLLYVTERRNLGEAISLRLAYNKLRKNGSVLLDDLNFLVKHNVVIPEDRKDIVRYGLYLGLNGELYAALHILLPQTENLIRELAKMCGDTATFLKEDGTEEFKPLSQLLNSGNLKESYDENLLFTLSTLLNERGGPNLRNELAHGFLSPTEGSSGSALCFLSLLIRFLSMYSPDSIEIFKKLTKR